MGPWLADDLRAVKDKTAQPLFEVALRYAVTTADSAGNALKILQELFDWRPASPLKDAG